jgi:hypothetical protein
MAEFIHTDRGEVNLAHVARYVYADGNLATVELFDANGNSLGISSGDPETGTIVPAAPGTIATVVTVNDLEPTAEKNVMRARREPPTREDLSAERVPVAAWRVTGWAADPIPAFGYGSIATNQTILLEWPDGQLEGFDCRYENLDAALAGILEEAQEEWHRRLAAAPEEPETDQSRRADPTIIKFKPRGREFSQ